MSKIITGIEFAILVAIIIGIIILLNVMEARRRINETRRQKHDDDLAYEEVKTRNDFKEALAHYNDTEHEQPCASMEPMCGAGNAHTRSREAVARAQHAARNSVSTGKPERPPELRGKS